MLAILKKFSVNEENEFNICNRKFKTATIVYCVEPLKILILQ